MNDYAELIELIGGFIHEMRNHLSSLRLNLQLLGEDFQDAQTQRERRAQTRVHRLQTECERLVSVSNDFLRFARTQQLNRQPTNLVALVEELLDFFGPTAQQAHIDIKSYVPSDLPVLSIDRELFKQALFNLLLNAQQAMPNGGQLTIQAALESEPAATVCLSLIDTGEGMTAEVQSKIFRPFFTTKPGGSGLGLATVRKIIRAHGGSIEVQSERARGTKFTIRIPVGGE